MRAGPGQAGTMRRARRRARFKPCCKPNEGGGGALPKKMAVGRNGDASRMLQSQSDSGGPVLACVPPCYGGPGSRVSEASEAAVYRRCQYVW